MSARQSLGKGFGSLIPDSLDPSILEDRSEKVHKILISDITPNPDQPRREFQVEQINELAESIKRHGILQPIIVVKNGDSYKIVAGERRWRAASVAKLEHVPAIVRSLEELEQVELALIENIQRVDLSPLEQALAVLKLQQEFNLTLDDIAKKLGKAPSTVSNLTRLLQLPPRATQALREGKIAEGHARAILALRGDEAKQEELLSCILDNGWTVRQAEEFVIRLKQQAGSISEADRNAVVAIISKKLGTKVAIKQTAKGGQLVIPFKNIDDIKSIADKL